MKFYLVDRIRELVPSKRILTVKNLSLAEEYLADHFPNYPVLPGVMMLEALVQSAAWLVRASTNFEKSIVMLREAQNVRYGSFVKPGGQLVMEVTVTELGPTSSRFKGTGTCDGQVAVQAKLTLEHLNIEDEDPANAEFDRPLREGLRQRFRLIGGPQALQAAAAGG